MQVGNFILMCTQENVLYKLPNGTEVYGDDEKVLIIDTDDESPTFMPEKWNPKTKEWVKCQAKEEKDWLFARSNLEYDLRDKEFESICYDSTDGYIQFDVLGWLHKHISPTFTADEDFYYYGFVFIGEKCYDLSRIIEDVSVKSSRELVLVCHREGQVYNITEELKRFFSKKKLPADVDEVYAKVKGSEMSLEEFKLWVCN